MKVLFIYTREFPQSPVKPLVDLEAIQFGISWISSFLKSNGHQTRLLVMTRSSDFTIIDQYLQDFDPQLVCCTAVASEYDFVARIGRYVKSSFPDRFLMIGGVHASLQPDEVMRDPFDACCIGEGEEATLEVVSQLEQGRRPGSIANLWIRQGDRLEKNPPRPFISDLDALPSPDREMWLEWIDLERSQLRPSILLGRGCPYQCTYCCNHALAKVAGGKYVRFRSQEHIIQELSELMAYYPGMKEVYFEVETLGANMAWGIELCHKLHDFNMNLAQPLAFGVNFRITPNLKGVAELFAALNSSNFSFVNIGLESGSERIRREILKRDYANEDVLEVVALARKSHLAVTFYNLIGLPTETLEDYRETVRMNRRCLPDKSYLSIFFPYPGTALHRYCKEQGFLPHNLLTVGKEREVALLSFPEFSRKQVQKAYIWFDYYVYKGHKPDYVLFDLILVRYLLANRGLRLLLLPFVLLADLTSRSRRFFPECREYLILKGMISAMCRKLGSYLPRREN